MSEASHEQQKISIMPGGQVQHLPAGVPEGIAYLGTVWCATAVDCFAGGYFVSGPGAVVTTTGSAAHAYSNAGTYTITLTVKDNYQQTHTL